MVLINHRLLIGQEVLARRSDDRWHKAVVQDVYVVHPTKHWEPPHSNDHIRVIFADNMTKSYLLQQDLDDVIKPVANPADLANQRFQAMRLRDTGAESQPLPLDIADLDSSQEEKVSSSSVKRLAPEGSSEGQQRRVQPRFATEPHRRPPVPAFQQGTPRCLTDDDDLFDDAALIEACSFFENSQCPG